MPLSDIFLLDMQFLIDPISTKIKSLCIKNSVNLHNTLNIFSILEEKGKIYFLIPLK